MTTTPIPPIMSVARFERFFRAAAGLDVDKNDLRRFSEFVNHKVYDLLVSARNTAKANAREKSSGIGRFGGEWGVEAFTTTHWISVQEQPRAYPI